MYGQIFIGADVVPTESNSRWFVSGEADKLTDKKLYELLKAAGFRIFNLEVPLADTETPLLKNGPALIAPTAAVNGYKALGADLVTVANNHILDQRARGFVSTLKTLKNAGIGYVGGGMNINQAAKPYIFEHFSKKIGIYACSEHEFCLAGESSCGANPFDPLETPDHITTLKNNCDYVIVLYHGGKEFYRYPTPGLQKVCRKLVDKGADLIICQHSHCIGCREQYKSGVIIYGQGNFLFDRSNSEYWQTGLLIGLDDKFVITYFPVVKDGSRVRLANKQECEKILGAFEARSEEIKDSNFVEEMYIKFARENIDEYLLLLGARRNILVKVVNKLAGRRYYAFKNSLIYDRAKYLLVQNFIECEAHRELLIRGLRDKVSRTDR